MLLVYRGARAGGVAIAYDPEVEEKWAARRRQCDAGSVAEHAVVEPERERGADRGEAAGAPDLAVRVCEQTARHLDCDLQHVEAGQEVVAGVAKATGNRVWNPRLIREVPIGQYREELSQIEVERILAWSAKSWMPLGRVAG